MIKSLLKRVSGAKDAKDEKDDFAKELKERRRSLKEEGKAVREGRDFKRVDSPGELPVSIILQPEAKKLSPKGSHIWKSRSDRAWQGDFPPFGMVSRGWDLHGDRGACLMVLQELWKVALETQSLEVTACPIKGLFEFSPGLLPVPPSVPSSSCAAAVVAPKAKAKPSFPGSTASVTKKLGILKKAAKAKAKGKAKAKPRARA